MDDTSDLLRDIARENTQASVKSHKREDDEDHEESDKLDKAIENSKAPGTMDMENRCGKPHNNGDDLCDECIAIKLNI